MSDMKPSERAAEEAYFTMSCHFEPGANSPRQEGVADLAAIIARVTGCDKPDPAREIVRRLVEWRRVTTSGVFVGDTLREIIDDAAALHAAGGGT